MIQYLWALRVCQGKGAKKLGIEESPLLGDKILREEVIKGDMTDFNHMILIGDLSHRMVE